jgi:hypothetical protein
MPQLRVCGEVMTSLIFCTSGDESATRLLLTRCVPKACAFILGYNLKLRRLLHLRRTQRLIQLLFEARDLVALRLRLVYEEYLFL